MSYFQPEFEVTRAPSRVKFGPGARHAVASEIDRLGCRRALVLSTPEQADLADACAVDIGARAIGVYTGAAMHTPVDVTETALAQVNEMRVDCLVAVGGGSTTGLGKAIAIRTDLPQIVVPTTYAGSEATPILGQTEGGRKTTMTDMRVLPEVIIYDAELVRTLPLPMTVASALNAVAHAVEALYARNRNPLSTAYAVEGLRAFNHALPRVMDNPDDLTARGETLYGAWLCGTVLGQVGMALHHKLCHTLGGSFGLPHAQTHAIVLPHATAFNARAVPDLLAPVCAIFGGDNAGLSLHEFAASVHAPMALRDLGLHESDLETAADHATENPYWNPQPMEREGILDLLRAAWAGHAPQS